MTSVVEARSGFYQDSVSLMQVSRRVSLVKGVEAALVAMATELNLDMLGQMGFTVPTGTRPDDLVIAVRAVDEASLARAQAELEQALAGSRAGEQQGRPDVTPARTVLSAARRRPATIALISVPGPYAFVEAMDALDAGLNVMIFSDNVTLEQEVALKEEARRRGLLVMGPDCGTAIVGGIGFGFANVVESGPVGIVAASGTGAQQLCCLLDHAGVGISHVLGVGGRDLSARVAGRSTLQALEALDSDVATELIVVVSKAPDQAVVDRVTTAAEALSTPVVLAPVGPGHRDLTEVAAGVAGGMGRPARPWFRLDGPAEPTPAGSLRGLYVGGTLCQEAMAIAMPVLGAIASNVPFEPAQALVDGEPWTGHVMVDFGDDRLTRGRAHPMIDPSLRLARLADAGADPTCSVVLLDVVLGHGAEEDPAAGLAPAIAHARRVAAGGGRDLAVVVSLCGTRSDAQDFERQAAALHRAGASVHLSNADAARRAVALAKGV
jgi:FdrA protein